MRKHLLLLFCLCSALVRAQQITVPANLYLADQRMNLSSGGQQEIQKRVDALLKYPKYFQARVELANIYFPIIEKVFREEGLPDDFKYLVLIESGLVADAVSTSNAVGFWQFKKETATDYGLRVNDQVDERKHIVESSRSAARYLLKSNNLYYNNWHNTILSYYYGFTGAKALARPEHVGRKEMDVTEKTDIYILKLLAHKVAYETAIGRNPAPAVVLQELPVAGRSLSDLALEMAIPEGELLKYNKWLSTNFIPSDKTYTLLVPVTNPDQQRLILASRGTASPAGSRADAPPVVTEKAGRREIQKRNGLKVIIARRGDTKDQLALQARMSTRRFLSLNDMYSFDPIVEGEAYYIERKKSKAQVPYHVVKPGERVQQIAQQYGVKVRSILWNNRMKANEVLATGRLLWLQHRRPADVPIEFRKSYPESTPTRAPANPVVLAQDQVLDEINAGKTPAARPEAPQTPARQAPAAAEKQAPSPERALEVGGPTPGEPFALEEPAAGPMDAALAHTNEEEDKDIILLTEEIDQQVEHINQPAPALYRKAATADTLDTSAGKHAGPPAATPASQDQPVPAGKTLPASGGKPAVTLREPAEAPQPASPVLKEPAPATAQAQEAPRPVQTPGIHVVAKGETLFSISRRYGITVDALKTWNSLGDLPLAIGQRLQVAAPPHTAAPAPVAPAGKPLLTASPAPQGGPLTHTVATGESMYQISRRYGVTIKDIMEWNGKADFNVIPGEKLLIKTVANSRQ